MNINKLAILTNQYGINDLADLLNIDTDVIQDVLQGAEISRFDMADLDEAFAKLEKKALRGKTDFDLDELEEQSEALENVLYMIDDTDNQELFRKIFALDYKKKRYRRNYTDENGNKKYKYLYKKTPKIEIEQLETLTTFFANSENNLRVQGLILEWLSDENNQAQTFLDKFKKDGLSLSWDKGDKANSSQFWAWFRETFY